MMTGEHNPHGADREPERIGSHDPPGSDREPDTGQLPLASELDPLIHEPARLRIMVTLAALGRGDSIWFVRLQEITGLTPGNLTTHLRRLEDGGYVVSSRGPGSGKASRTYMELTVAGREALNSYKATLQSLLSLSEDPVVNPVAEDGSGAIRAIREQGRVRPRAARPGLSSGTPGLSGGAI